MKWQCCVIVAEATTLLCDGVYPYLYVNSLPTY